METNKPVWRLKKPCPCCEQGGLVFSTCPACGHVLLICEEQGTVFPETRDLSRDPIGEVDDPSTVCPACHNVALSEFRDSTGDEVQQLGFHPGEYE
jgi:hypothetical protein